MFGKGWVQKGTQGTQENDDLEPVWPYGLVGDNTGTLTQLGQRTFTNRKIHNYPDWTFDAVHAARLGLSTEVHNNLIQEIQTWQQFINGIGTFFNTSSPGYYIEFDGDTNNAVQEALVQDYDDLLRIVPAWPMSSWDVSGTGY